MVSELPTCQTSSTNNAVYLCVVGALIVQAGTAHVINLTERRIRNDVEDGAGGGLLSVRSLERRTRVLHELTEVQVLVVESVANLMFAKAGHDRRGLGLHLPVVAAVARFIEAEPARRPRSG